MRMARATLNRKQTRALIIAAAIVLAIVIIGICVLRFGFPGKWDELMDALFSRELVEGQLVVHFIDVGQGDGIYIEFPDGKDMIIDMGSTKGFSAAEAISVLKQLNPDGTVDHLMLTHSDQDHVRYLDEVINEFDVANIYMPNIKAEPKTSTQSGSDLVAQIEALNKSKLALFTDPDTVATNAYAEFFIAALSEKNCKIHLNEDSTRFSNDIIISGEGYTFTFWCPTSDFYDDNNLNTAEKLNAVSPVGILEFNGRRIVFTGDSNSLNEPIIAERIGHIDCDILKVAHHGSATSSTLAFLNAVDCEYAVISCGSGNDYGHPTQSALDRLRAQNMTVYRTDLNGNVTLTVDAQGKLNFDVDRVASTKDIFTGYDEK